MGPGTRLDDVERRKSFPYRDSNSDPLVAIPTIPTSKSYREGRTVAQAVRRWLPTAAAQVRARAACGVCGGQSGTGAGFLRVLQFPLPIIHQFLHHHNHLGLAQ
jgi:hypothetical protein